MTDIINLTEQVTFAGRGMGFKKVHVTIPIELYDAFSKRYPYGCRSRILSVALADKLKKAEEEDIKIKQWLLKKRLLINTNWDEITENE